MTTTTLLKIAIGCWMFLSAANVIGGLIGWFQLRSDHRRASFYLSRILLAIAIRSVFVFIGLYNWSPNLMDAPIFIVLSVGSATLLTGAIWGWLFYLRGVWNGGGWRDLVRQLKGNPDE